MTMSCFAILILINSFTADIAIYEDANTQQQKRTIQSK